MGFSIALFGKYRFREKIMKKIITSESVNIGHPDKTCDVIADSFLDEALKQDPNAQMAVECAIKDDKLFIYGEATTTAKIDYEKCTNCGECARNCPVGCIIVSDFSGLHRVKN